MNENKLKKLIALFADSELDELEIQSFWSRVKLARNRNVGPQQVPSIIVPAADSTTSAAAATSTSEPASVEPASTDGLHVVTSPMVGTLYLASSPEEAPFVKKGDQVTTGQTVCVIEAMKIMNEIEADVKGEIVEILVDNGNPVEYNQPLVHIRPT